MDAEVEDVASEVHVNAIPSFCDLIFELRDVHACMMRLSENLNHGPRS